MKQDPPDGEATGAVSEARRGLSHHILPNAGTMVGVCTTLIGLVKITETQHGPSRVDEYGGLVGLVFLTSAIFSYMSIRDDRRTAVWARRFERAADGCFVGGLAGLTAIAILFAYEFI